eukprot:1147981-Pelagomonas_calceolata.AAC.2
MKRVPRTNSRYPLRSREGHGGSREHSAPAIAPPPAYKLSRPSSQTTWLKKPGPRISLRPPSSSSAIYVTTFQGPQLNLAFIPTC